MDIADMDEFEENSSKSAFINSADMKSHDYKFHMKKENLVVLKKI